MPSKNRKQYFERINKKKNKLKEQEAPGKIKLEKRSRPGSKKVGVIYFILALFTSVSFTLADYIIPGILVTSVLIFFAIKNFRDAPISE